MFTEIMKEEEKEVNQESFDEIFTFAKALIPIWGLQTKRKYKRVDTTLVNPKLKWID